MFYDVWDPMSHINPFSNSSRNRNSVAFCIGHLQHITYSNYLADTGSFLSSTHATWAETAVLMQPDMHSMAQHITAQPAHLSGAAALSLRSC
jgi:hypothetical protein